MKLRYAKRAFRDLEQILTYLNERSPAGAGNVLARIDAAAHQLRRQPLSGKATDRPGIRVSFVGRHPYLVFYRIEAEGIEILHIRHASRRPFAGD